MTSPPSASAPTHWTLACVLSALLAACADVRTRPASDEDSCAWPLTRPEASGYAETSRYADVVEFMEALAAASPEIHLTTYGYTYEGRPMLLAVAGAPAATPEAVRATGKTRVFMQGNIHAGEVEGKEAALVLLRSLAKGERPAWLANVVLLVAPLYNADGNERVSVKNRGAQNGPVGGMGQRHNAQDLDLNRDATKMETAEARSLARLLTQYDPHVAIDMHTTDGSSHGYYLTYEVADSPNTSPGITRLLRDELLPSVTQRVKQEHGWDFFYYGGPTRTGERAWSCDDDLYKPRYTHTYFGIRNRLGILSEAYSYATFEERIQATCWFVEGIVDYVVAHGAAIRAATAAADAESIVGTQQAVRGKLVRTADSVPIVLADVVAERNPYVPERPMLRRVKGSERVENMPFLGTIEASETSLAPRAYVIPAPSEPAGTRDSVRGPAPEPAARMLAAVIDRLEAHGIRYTRTSGEQTLQAERFRIASSTQEEEAFQGHKLRTLTGAWEPVAENLPAGSLVVPMDQPLARLAFVLFDARSDDGFMAWNLLDSVLGATPPPEFYPVLRTLAEVTP
ncbi:MAG: peptidase M14 [Planctomycetes bacterium]|nr:peptidase M14 [Planctomycetota bacterium]